MAMGSSLSIKPDPSAAAKAENRLVMTLGQSKMGLSLRTWEVTWCGLHSEAFFRETIVELRLQPVPMLRSWNPMAFSHMSHGW